MSMRTAKAAGVLLATLVLALVSCSSQEPRPRATPQSKEAVSVDGLLAPGCTVRSAAVHPPSMSGALILGVDAISANNIWAVGRVGAHLQTRGLIEHWDGQRWTTTFVPYILYSVANTSPTDVWASGIRFFKGGGAVIRLVNGRWVEVPTPPTPKDGLLIGLAVVSPKDIWAAGLTTKTSTPLIEHWNGASWSLADTGSLPAGSVLKAISAEGGVVWAVGDSGPSPDRRQALMVRLATGPTDVAPVPPSPSTDTQLHGVFVLSPSDVWAVGLAGTKAISAHYDGKVWSYVPMAIPPGKDPVERHVAGVSPTDLWAVGDQGDSGDPLMEHWDGRNWTLASSTGSSGRLFAAASQLGVGVFAGGAGPTVLELCRSRLSH